METDIQSSIHNCSPHREMPWPHAPVHKLSEAGTFMVTAGTYGKLHHFRGKDRLSVLCRGLLTVARDFRWTLEAWAVFSNHYHFIGHSPEDAVGAESLRVMLALLHETTSVWVNRVERTRSRTIWHNFWETRLTYQRSYLARLNYVHQNPVKHGLVSKASQYPWCSARWFERTATNAQVNTIYAFKTDRLNVLDGYATSAEW